MEQKTRIEIIERLQNHTPNLSTELKYQTNFELLIALILSAKSKDIHVNKVTKKLFKVANTPLSILSIGEEKLKNYIKSIGLYNKKSIYIINTCQILIKLYKGEIPENRKILESLPGVGRKIANVMLNTAFNWPTIAVDTHVFRVCNRTHFVKGKNNKIIERKLISVVSDPYKFKFHYLFLNHGKKICSSRNPKCNYCIISDLCFFFKKNS